MNDIGRKMELFRETYVRGAGDAGETDISGRAEERGEDVAAEKTAVDAGLMDSVGGMHTAGDPEQYRTATQQPEIRSEERKEIVRPEGNACHTRLSVAKRNYSGNIL